MRASVAVLLLLVVASMSYHAGTTEQQAETTKAQDLAIHALLLGEACVATTIHFTDAAREHLTPPVPRWAEEDN